MHYNSLISFSSNLLAQEFYLHKHMSVRYSGTLLQAAHTGIHHYQLTKAEGLRES